MTNRWVSSVDQRVIEIRNCQPGIRMDSLVWIRSSGVLRGEMRERDLELRKLTHRD